MQIGSNLVTVTSFSQFPVFWEHDPYPWNWEFQQCFVKNWENIITGLKFCND